MTRLDRRNLRVGVAVEDGADTSSIAVVGEMNAHALRAHMQLPDLHT
jgi:hypothetical protein